MGVYWVIADGEGLGLRCRWMNMKLDVIDGISFMKRECEFSSRAVQKIDGLPGVDDDVLETTKLLETAVCNCSAGVCSCQEGWV